MADRTYSKAFEIQKAAPAFSYVEDTTLYGGAGGWRPLRPSDFSNITLSGAQVNIDNSAVEALLATNNSLTTSGNNYLSSVQSSNSAIYGAIASGNAVLESINEDTASASKAFTPGAAASLLVKNGAGTLFTVNGYSSATGVQYLHIYDNTSAASNLVSVLAIDSSDNFSIDFGDKGIAMNSGIYIRNSLSPFSLATGASDLFFTAVYK